MKIILPDMEFCRQLGWVRFPDPVTARTTTRAGLPRKIRLCRLTATQYTRERRARLKAAGLTVMGTPFKRNRTTL